MSKLHQRRRFLVLLISVREYVNNGNVLGSKVGPQVDLNYQKMTKISPYYPFRDNSNSNMSFF